MARKPEWCRFDTKRHSNAPDTHREWEYCTDHHEFKREWYPHVRQTMRCGRRGHALIWEEDYLLIRWWKGRQRHRSWKLARFTQYRVVNNSVAA